MLDAIPSEMAAAPRPYAGIQHLAIVTDAWHPQINGVVTTLEAIIAELESGGVRVTVIHPGLFPTLPLPGYPEIRVAVRPQSLKQQLLALRPDAVHVATEGPLGLSARNWLRRRGVTFSTSVHTKFPEYLHKRTRVPVALGYRAMRWFHQPASATLCTTEGHRAELEQWGLQNLMVCSLGVDMCLFQPRPRAPRRRPRLLYVGRIATEKSVDDFLSLDIDAEKVVVGDGPDRLTLQKRFPDARWLGYLRGQPLAQAYADADVFVFPSRTDTFGLVMIEAMACGTPVAAYPVTGPRDVVRAGVSGYLSENLKVAVTEALKLDRGMVHRAAKQFSWAATARHMWQALKPINWHRLGA